MNHDEGPKRASWAKRRWFSLGSRLILILSKLLRVELDGSTTIPRFGGTWISAAIHYEDIELLAHFMRMGGEWCAPDRYGRCPLSYAALRGFDEAIWLICSFGVFNDLTIANQDRVARLANGQCQPSTVSLLNKLQSPLGAKYQPGDVSVSMNLQL